MSTTVSTAERVQETKETHLIEVIHFADPWCWWSWGLEPVVNRIKQVYGDQIKIVYKMGGITDNVSDWRKEYDVVEDEALRSWISDSNSITGMPVDPECYLKSKVTSTWPACIAIKAAQLQNEDLAEQFYRKMMEGNLLESTNGADKNVYLQLAKEIGLDVLKLKSDIGSGIARKLFEEDKKGMDVNFLSLRYVNKKTRKKTDLDNVFSSADHEKAIEQLSNGQLSKKTPIDILEYFEHHGNDYVGAKEIAEIFRIPKEAEDRLTKLSSGGILRTRRFEFGGTYWILATESQKTELSLEEVKISHGAGPSQTRVETGFGEMGLIPETALESFAGVGYPHASNAIEKSNSVPDIGSGSGTDVLVASLRTGPAGDVTGLDITDAMIEKARANIERMGAKNVKILKVDATQIPLEESSVDVVSSNGVLNLVPEKRKRSPKFTEFSSLAGGFRLLTLLSKAMCKKYAD